MSTAFNQIAAHLGAIYDDKVKECQSHLKQLIRGGGDQAAIFAAREELREALRNQQTLSDYERKGIIDQSRRASSSS